ncbi:conjugal transfer protein MobB [Bacteroides sp. 519]|uniref:conjugal transfer protein MobB n=1 Tax=Bacteroides sp. 519 TaxID=2302937 RepID=UPI0013D00591|nr:conjugal transfer protein MobB [Bacteroides sp. 519]NDV56695.1 mobilization protein [Bacteroides sp. 519]
MVADIHKGSNLYGALAYNQDKIDNGKGQILETNRVFVPFDGHFRVSDCVRDFEQAMPSQIKTGKPVIHISLNPHPDDRLTDTQLADISREYLEKMGFGGQPYMIFKHEDIDRQHVHIISTRVRGDGSIISDSKDYERSRKITDALEQKYGLHPKGESQKEAWQLSPVDVQAGNLKRQVANVIKPLSEMYRFQSLTEYRALLSLYNIGIEKVEGNNGGNKYTGLVYSALDADGNRAGKPLKSSLFGKSQGVELLEQKMKRSGEAIKSERVSDKTKAIIAEALKTSRTESDLRMVLRDKGIDMVLRRNDTGRIYGATFIDHNTRTVLNGSRMGKEFSANALNERFADSSPREDLHTPVPQTTDNLRNIPAPDDKAKTPTPDLSAATEAAGNLFSFLTPEEGQNDNQSVPKRRKKKKRRYGRQM